MFKKIGFFLGTISAILIFIYSPSVFAADYDKNFWDTSQYTLQDENTIHVGTGSQRVTFTNPSGNTYPKGTYHVQGYPSVPAGICTGNNAITVSPANLNKATIPGSLDIVYQVTASNGSKSCQGYKKSNLQIKNPTAGGTCNYLVCSKDDINALAKSTFTFTDTDTIETKFKNKLIEFKDGDVSDSNHTFQVPAGLFCSGGGRDHFGAISIPDDSYKNISKDQKIVGGLLDVDWYNAASKKCSDYGTDSNNNTSSIKINAQLIAAQNTTTVDSSGAASGDDCQAQAADSNIAGRALAFVACPMLDSAQSVSDWLIGQVENLLSFTFQRNLGNDTQRDNVQNAWSQIRDLASVFLVIIMLVMVLSQAVSWGPFDAYTVKKVLPKLVIAVIAMQLSWSLLDYVVRLFDDFGRGIANLLYAPFGGPGQLQLRNILQEAGIQAYAGGSVVLASLIGIAAIAVLSLPTILLVGWSIVLSLLVAFVTLSIRQILIIASVILAPLAILLWILPGTQRYWKMWYDNLTKLLLMFPLLIGLIAIGRIFAYITSSGTNDTLVKFILILIGYFGPFFLIPKAYKWGGQALSLAGGALSNVAPKLGGPVTNYLKGAQERSRWHLAREARKSALTNMSKERFAQGLAEGNFINRARLLGATRNRAVIGRATQSARAEREKILQEQAAARLIPMLEEATRSDDWTAIRQMALTGNGQERETAIRQMVQSRRWADLAQYRTSATSTEDWDRTFAKNGDLFNIVNDGRADLSGPNLAAPITQLVGALPPATLGNQHRTFFQEAETAFAAMPAGPARDTALSDYSRNVEQALRLNPQAFQGILNTPGETAADNILGMHAAAAGTNPETVRDIMQRVRAPGGGAVPSQGIAGGAPAPITAAQQAIFSENDVQVQQRVAATPAFGGHPAGTWAAYAANPATSDDAMFIYQHKQGPIKEAAEQALRTAGHFPSP